MKPFYFLTPRVTMVALIMCFALVKGAGQVYCAKVDFTYDVQGQEVKFLGSSPETVQEWYWYFGDNTTIAKGQAQKHIYSDQGSYEVCLKILVNENCTGAVCKKVQVGNNTPAGCDLKPEFHYTVTGNAVKFSGTSTSGDNGKYYWSFGNGLSAEGREVSSTYNADGSYEVCMKVLAPSTTAAGVCSDYICKKIQIGNTPGNGCELKPDFQFSIDGRLVKLTGSSTAGDNAKYYWSFGNGQSAEGRTALAEYPADGTYEICMKVHAPAISASTGPCTDGICKKIQVGSNTAGCDLKAGFEYKKDGLNGYFAATSDDPNATYYWNVTGQSEQYTGKDVKITFAKAGNYEVCLTAVNGSVTCKVQVCKKVEIGNGCDLKADFTFETSGLTYTFKAASSAGSQAKYYWSFGNGNSAEGQQVSTTFAGQGYYEVCLKVVGGPSTTATNACVDVVCKKIQAGQDVLECPLEADFKYSTNGNVVTFKASSNDDKATYYWFGTGLPSAAALTGSEVVFTFVHDGVFEVCLVAVDGAQTCKVKVCKKVTVGDNIKVYPNPATDFINFIADRVIVRAGIYDQMNKELLTTEINNHDGRIDVSGLPSGLYLARLQMEDQTVYSATFYKK